MPDPIDAAVAAARAAFAAGDAAAAFRALEPFVSALPDDERLALAWSAMLGTVPSGKTLATEVERFAWHWGDHPDVMANVCRACVAWAAERPLDVDVPDDDPVVQGAQALRRCLEDVRRVPRAAPLFLELAQGLTAAGPRWDDDALEAFEAALDLAPTSVPGWLAVARHHLRRRRFDKARAAAEYAATLEPPNDPVHWMLGVTATAVGDGAAAADAWRALGHDVGTGDDGLPLLEAPPVEIVVSGRLPGGAEAPEREAVEVVWVKPHSPCHGRLVTPTVHALPVDFDDRVLWDPAPLTFRDVDGRRVPRFDALTVLAPGRAATWRLRGTQPARGALGALDAHLPAGCFVYVHDEQVMGGRDAQAIEGKLVAPRALDRAAVEAHLAAAVARVPDVTAELRP
ncbi:MAG: hypothetical protein H6704_23935 [Myxococcales bacterium]|nr:hypothetical protein [Myxococcales bacterium]